jgi:hypothetical protein
LKQYSVGSENAKFIAAKLLALPTRPSNLEEFTYEAPPAACRKPISGKYLSRNIAKPEIFPKMLGGQTTDLSVKSMSRHLGATGEGRRTQQCQIPHFKKWSHS